MCESNENLVVGPYTIDTTEPIRTYCKRREGQPLIKSYRCSKGEKRLTARCIYREIIGAAAKKKQYQKWN